jgi:hypothetical protein
VRSCPERRHNLDAIFRYPVESTKNIDPDGGYLSRRGKLDRIQLRWLDIARFNAANAPQSLPDLARERLVAKNAQYDWPADKNRGRAATLPD